MQFKARQDVLQPVGTALLVAAIIEPRYSMLLIKIQMLGSSWMVKTHKQERSN